MEHVVGEYRDQGHELVWMKVLVDEALEEEEDVFVGLLVVVVQVVGLEVLLAELRLLLLDGGDVRVESEDSVVEVVDFLMLLLVGFGEDFFFFLGGSEFAF